MLNSRCKLNESLQIEIGGCFMRSKDPELKQKIYTYINEFSLQNMRSPSFQEIANELNINKATAYRYVLEMSDEESFDIEYKGTEIICTKSKKITHGKIDVPVVGKIACGDPTSEEENIEEYVYLPESIFGKGPCFILRANGDSMEDAGIHDGDLVVIEKKLTCEPGDIVVALDNEGQNTLKAYGGIHNGKAVLEYMNEAVYPGKEILVDSLEIQGVAKMVIKSVKKKANLHY